MLAAAEAAVVGQRALVDAERALRGEREQAAALAKKDADARIAQAIKEQKAIDDKFEADKKAKKRKRNGRKT